MYIEVHYGGITITITLNVLVYHRKTQFENYGKYRIAIVCHNALVHHISKCNSIVSSLEKRCVKFL